MFTQVSAPIKFFLNQQNLGFGGTVTIVTEEVSLHFVQTNLSQ